MIPTRKRTTTAVLLLLILAGVIGLLLMPIPHVKQWHVRLLDLGHIPLFAALTLGIGRLLGRRYLLTTVILLFVAIAAELVQGRFERSGNLPDFLRSAIGIVIALLLIQWYRSRHSARSLLLYGLTIVGLLIWPIKEAAPFLLEAIDAHTRFPVIINFRHEWQLTDFEAYNARLERVLTPDGDRFVGQVECQPGKEFAGVLLTPVVSDWSGYEKLCVEILGAEQPVKVTMVVKDTRPFYDYHNRFNYTREYGPGTHVRSIALADIAQSTRNGPLDLGSIQFLNFFCSDLSASTRFCIGSIWLE